MRLAEGFDDVPGAFGLAQRLDHVGPPQRLGKACQPLQMRPRVALRGLVEAQRRQDDREAALKTLDELAERFPDELDAFGLRAELRLQAGDRAGALADLKRVQAQQERMG